MGQVERLVAYSLVYGMLDEKNRGRDRIPDRSVVALAKGIVGARAFYLWQIVL